MPTVGRLGAGHKFSKVALPGGGARGVTYHWTLLESRAAFGTDAAARHKVGQGAMRPYREALEDATQDEEIAHLDQGGGSTRVRSTATAPARPAAPA
jgi:hypothetical protein